jgi:CHAT domain-containing protein
MYYIKTHLLFVALFLFSNYQLFGQKQNANDIYASFTKYYSSGDFINAERSLISILSKKDTLSQEYKTAIYNNLGALNIVFGRYDIALAYFNLAEKNVSDPNSLLLAGIYTNKARIYGINKESDNAIDYLEQGIKIYLKKKDLRNSVLDGLSKAYLNLGVTYIEKKNYNSALFYLFKSNEINLKYNISTLGLTYLNIAKIYAQTNEPEKAQLYFIKSVNSFKNEFGENYYRLVEVYFDYGLFLRSKGKTSDAYEIHQRALSICLKNYGEKHTFVSLAYKLLGDHFLMLKDYQSALEYYQNSIIAVVKNYNDSNIYSNPELDSVIFDTRLLANLKQKSAAFDGLTRQELDSEKKKQLLTKGFETIELALNLISRIRSGFLSPESKTYLAENEKETYIFAIHIAEELYKLTLNEHYLQKMYEIATLSKSALLRNELTENDLLYQSIPDSIHKKRNDFLINIASYNKLIQDELQKLKPNLQRIDSWKSSLFEIKRAKEKLDERINLILPQIENLLRKTEPISLKELQLKLNNDETIVEYFLSNHYNLGKRAFYTFIISHNQLSYNIAYLDSLFIFHVEAIKQGVLTNAQSCKPKLYKDYTDALYYMYHELVSPIEISLVGKKLIIIPDEEIAYLPFDAFIKKRPDSDQVNYEGLQYLVYDYSISYSYISSLIFNKERSLAKPNTVYAFSPSYGQSTERNGNILRSLKGTRSEIKMIFDYFNGKEYFGTIATKSNFQILASQPAIFHLAMHSEVDSANSKYSSLIFDSQMDNNEDAKLFNYEIGLLNMKSPMVVLSACNTGTGNLYHGEGVMSITRGFILAGTSSVVNTFWDVNDDASSQIMKDFYYFLFKGEEKGDALRKAKLNYLKTTTPTYANPYYWAAYEVMGDKSPIKSQWLILKILLATMLIGIVSYISYRKWSRSS